MIRWATKSACCRTFLAGTRTGRSPRSADRPQGFLELVLVIGDAQIGQVKDFRSAAIVRLQFEDPAVRIAVGEAHDVFVIRPSKRVDTLGIIAHDHQVPVSGSKQIHDLRLQCVRVLILVHKNVEEAIGVRLPYFGKRAGGAPAS